MPAVYRTRTRPIAFVDTDMAGIVHFSRFFVLMEEIEQEFLRSRGLSVIFEEDGTKYGFPRVAAQCDFKRPVVFEDILDATLRVERVGEVVAVGRVSTCCILHGHPTLSARPIPPRARQILERD